MNNLKYLVVDGNFTVTRSRCGIYQCCYKFWLWIFFFCNLCFQHFFNQNFIPKFFLFKLFSKIFFFKTFFKFFFFNFFKIFLFKTFFKIFSPKLCFQKFVSNFSKFVFWGLYSRCSPVYRDETHSMYLYYEKYDIQANIAFRLQHTKFSVFRLILRPGNHTTLSFKIQN